MYYEMGNVNYTSCIYLQHLNIGFQCVLQGIAA